MANTPCSRDGTLAASNFMKGITQSSLSAFHNTSGEELGSGSKIRHILEFGGRDNDYFMKADILNYKLFRKSTIFRPLGYYVLYYISSSFNVDNFWVTWDTDRTTIRLYINYRKLLKDFRTLEDLKEHIHEYTKLKVNISSDFVGIIDIELDELDTTLTKEISNILNIELGTKGIIECYENGFIVGSNFGLMMDNKFIKKETLYSNNIIQVYEQLGIEAARSVYHLQTNDILADFATFEGKPTPFTKYGLVGNDDDNKLLVSMGFERSGHDIKRIGKSRECTDHLTNISSQIMVGMDPPTIGTNSKLFEIRNK